MTQVLKVETVAGSSVIYINALTPSSNTVVATGVTIIHRQTGHELTLDVLAENDRFATLLAIVNQLYPKYEMFESWAIEQPAATTAIAA